MYYSNIVDVAYLYIDAHFDGDELNCRNLTLPIELTSVTSQIQSFYN